MTCLVGEVSTKNGGDEGQRGATRGDEEGRDEAVSGRYGGCLERQCIQLPYDDGTREGDGDDGDDDDDTATMNDNGDSMGVELNGK